uniref:Uncharacterized protein n=1 Tax=Arundo donax TaxID=35708 RepID=A0A0A9EWE7_ARUDO
MLRTPMYCKVVSHSAGTGSSQLIKINILKWLHCI